MLLFPQVIDVRPNGNFRCLEPSGPPFVHHLVNVALSVFEVAEELRVSGACGDAGGLKPLLNSPPAEITLIHFLRDGIDIARIVRARLHAVTAPDAKIAVHHHDAVFSLIRGSCRTGRNAGRMVTVVALSNIKSGNKVREFARDARRMDMGPCKTSGNVPLRIARHRAGLATNALRNVRDRSVACHLVFAPYAPSAFSTRTKFTRIPVAPMMGSTLTRVISSVSEAPR